MKKIIFLLTFFFCLLLIGCGGNPQKINDVEYFESLFDGGIKYDIRDVSLCEEGHIKGFLCVGSEDNETIIKNIDVIAQNKKVNIILIGEEEDVLYVLEGLSKKGYKNLYYFEGGYLGYSLAKGESFIPEEGCGC